MKQLILASTSTYRRALLDRLGLPYTAVAPPEPEDHSLSLPPEDLVRELATRKARSLGARFPDALILGADQVAELDGQVLFKPGALERALEQLRRLAGRSHRLLTGVALFEPASGRLESALDIQRMKMRPLSEGQIRRSLEIDRPFDCAGAYKVEGAGIALFEALSGDDYTGIIGLPLTRVVELLGRFGIELP